jgi:hypothetical protein
VAERDRAQLEGRLGKSRRMRLEVSDPERALDFARAVSGIRDAHREEEAIVVDPESDAAAATLLRVLVSDEIEVYSMQRLAPVAGGDLLRLHGAQRGDRQMSAPEICQATFQRDSLLRGSFLVASKEVKESLYGVRGSMWAVLSAIVLSLMSYLLLTDKELSLLDQSEMLYIITSLAVGLGLLVVGILAADAMVGEKERSTLEGLLLTPVGRGSLVAGKIFAVVASWLLIFVISAPYIFVGSAGTNLSGTTLLYTLVLGTLCVGGFAALTVAPRSSAPSSPAVETWPNNE